MRIGRRIRTLYASQRTLYRRLLRYMLGIAALVFGMLLCLLLVFGRLSSPGEHMADQLDLQMEFFRSTQTTLWEQLAATGLQLSEDAAAVVEEYPAALGTASAAEEHIGEHIQEHIQEYTQENTGEHIQGHIQDYTQEDTQENTGEHILTLERLLLTELCETVRRTDCSGGFIMLTDGQPDRGEPLPGIYVKKETGSLYSQQMVLYRGIAKAAEAQNLALHGKWRMSFEEEDFPQLRKLLETVHGRAGEQYRVLPSVFLPGTDDCVWLLAVPLTGSEGEIRGLCGLEISRTWFRTQQQIPTRLNHLLCFVSKMPDSGGTDGNDIGDGCVDGRSVLDCGTSYYPPSGQLFFTGDGSQLIRVTDMPVPEAPETAAAIDHDMLRTDAGHSSAGSVETGRSVRYIGLQKPVSLSPAQPDFLLTVCMPLGEYRSAVIRGNLQVVLLIFLVLFFVIFCGSFLSRRYVSPIRKALNGIRQNAYDQSHVNIPELDEMSGLLNERKKEHEKQMNHLTRQKMDAEHEAQRLAYSRKTEIDPLIYDNFTEGLKTLTPSERRILDLYLDGMGTKEVMETLNIKESTLRYHNKNIYSRLGVNSRKQAVLYASVARRNGEWKDRFT